MASGTAKKTALRAFGTATSGMISEKVSLTPWGLELRYILFEYKALTLEIAALSSGVMPRTFSDILFPNAVVCHQG